MKFDAETYDTLYDNPQGLRENEEIKKLLEKYTPNNILDLGCGTGLVYELLKPKNYEGLDVDATRVDYANKKYNTDIFSTKEAKQCVRELEEIANVTSVFSLNYFDPEIIPQLVKKAKGNILFIHYNQPFLDGSSSYYLGEEEHFEKAHTNKKILIEYHLIKNNFKTFKLLDQDYYYVSVLER